MKIAFNPSTVAALTSPPDNKDITFDLSGHNIFARGVKFYGTDTNTWRDIKVNNVSIGSHTLDLRNGSNTTLTNTNGVVTINSTWRPVVDNLTSNSTTSSLSANQGRVLAGLINGKSDSDHNHDGRYVKKSGDTMIGALNFANHTWNKIGDDSYMGDCNVSGHVGIKASNTTYPGVTFFNNASTFLGNLTAYNGNIKYGTYSLQFLDNGNTSVNASTWTNPFSSYNSNAVADGQAICVWGQSSYLGNLAADTGDMSLWLKRINAKGATLNMVLDGEYYANGNQRLAHASEIPTSLKNPHALTISLNGTSQGPYDGSAAKNINITPGSIGAAVSDHSHDYLVVNTADDKSFNSAYHNFQVLFAVGSNGITGKPSGVDAFGLLRFRAAAGWSGQMLLANGGSLYIRSSEDAKMTNTLAWKTILDSSNYSGILDSRYYTESEVNSLLDAKLNRQNLSYGTWNPRGYHLAADYQYNGGDLSISENSGQIHVSIDGYFWQNEGRYRVLDTSDVAGLKGDLTVHQHLSATDNTWYPLIWGGSSHANTNDSTGAVYKSHDKLSWQTSSQTLYATHLRTTYIDLENNRGIFQVTSGGTSPFKGIKLPDLQANGIGLFSRVKNGNDEGGIILSEDTCVIYNSFNTGWGLSVRDKDMTETDISGDGTIAFGVRQDHRAYSLGGFEKSGSDNSYVLLGGGGHKAESALNVANADTVDGAHLIRYGNGTGIKQAYYFYVQGDNTSYIKLGTLNTVAVTGYGTSKVMFTVRGGIDFGKTNESVYEVAASTRGSIQVTSTLVRGNRELKFGYVSTSSNVEIWMAYDGTHRGVTEVEVSSSVSFTLAMTETTTKPSGFIEGSYRILASTADNIASATKLQTPRSIWGQSFDGTANVDNTLRIRQTTGNYCEGIRIQTADSTWATIILGATGDSGTNANAWSIHRKADNNFAISRNSNDGLNGLVMTHTGMGLGTTAPTQRLDVAGNIRATGQLYLPTNGNYNAILMGDDCWLGDCNIGNVIGLSGRGDSNAGGIKFGKGGMHIGYNGSNHYSSGTSLWSNFNADLLDSYHYNSFAPFNGIKFTHMPGDTTWHRILQFTTNWVGQVTFMYSPEEYQRDYWGIFNINIRSNDIQFMGFSFANVPQIKCIGDDNNNWSVWIKGDTNSYDPYGVIQVLNYSNASIVNVGLDKSQTTEPSGTYNKAPSLFYARFTDWNNIINKPSTFAPSAHTHTVFNNNLMIKGTNGISNIATIHLGIGDSDTGFKWISDGVCQICANNVAIGQWTSGGMDWFNNPTVNGNKVWNAGNDGSGSGLDADTLDGYHENSFLRYRVATSTDQEATLWNQIGIKQYHNALPDNLTGVYNYGSVISLPGPNSRFEIYASHMASSGNGLYYRSGWNSDKKSWLKFIDSSNIGSQTVASANKLTTARTIWGQSFDGTGNVDGPIRVHYKSGDWNNYNEGIRLYGNGKDNSWSSIHFGCDPATISGTHANQWFIGRNTSNQFGIFHGTNTTTGIIHITTNDNVGIGTMSPSYKLDVNGNIWCRGALNVGSTLSITDSVINCSSNNISINSKGFGTLMIGGYEVIRYSSNQTVFQNKAIFFQGFSLPTGFINFTRSSYTTDDVTVLIDTIMKSQSFYFKPANDGQLLFLKIGRVYSNIQFQCTAQDCEVVKANGFGVHLARNETKNYFGDGLARIFIYKQMEAQWYEFYCG